MKFTLFGDLHYSENYLEIVDFDVKREAYFGNFIQSVFRNESDYHVSIGDLTNLGTQFEFMGINQLINRYKQEACFIQVLGNHDLYTQTRQALRSQIYGDFYYSFVQDDICVIVLDTNREKSLLDWSGYVDSEQLAWLQTVFKQNADKVVVMFGHHPLYNTTLYSTADKKYIMPDCGLAEIMAQHKGPSLYVCGHTHADSIYQKANWTYIQLADVMNQPSIRTLEVDKRGVRLTAEPINPAVHQKGLWLGSRMRHFAITERGYQGSHNREISFEFEKMKELNNGL